MEKLVLFFCLWMAVPWVSSAQENKLWVQQVPVSQAQMKLGTFAGPNEQYIGILEPTLRQAPPGIYMSVGTERGFMGAALAKNTSQLVLIDRDDGIVAYNHYNLILLKIAIDRIDYLRLRLLATQDELHVALKNSNLTTAELNFALNYHTLFHRQLKKHLDAGDLEFEEFHKAPEKPDDKFFGANYLFDDALFGRLQGLAKSDAIHIYKVDLNEPGEVRQIIADVGHSEIKISVFDISNAWTEVFIRSLNMEFLLNELSNHVTEDSLFIATARMADQFSLAPYNGPRGVKYKPFIYSTFDFGHIFRLRTAENFLNKLWPSFKSKTATPYEPSTRHNNIELECEEYLRFATTSESWFQPKN